MGAAACASDYGRGVCETYVHISVCSGGRGTVAEIYVAHNLSPMPNVL